MKFKLLGRTGVQVSQLCFGTMSFGGDADETESTRMFKQCRDRGINFFDCADGYSRGKAESILGKLIKGSRDELVITSKCFVPMSDDINARGGNRRHILQAVDASLKRLGTDRLDILLMHRWDPVVPLEETLRALEKCVADGKVLYIGASNYAAWQIAKGLGISQSNGWSRFDVIQPMYSLVKRQAETEIFPLADAENLGVMAYSTVAGGLLSGKYSKHTRPAGGRIVTNPEYADRYSEDGVFDLAEQFSILARELGVHPVSLAVAWAASHPSVTCPIIGARDVEQLQPALDAANIVMSDELRNRLSNMTRTPPPATDRLEEQLKN
jgi:aryl-alcohol dehydrogenase-like predicted oxidoreductase